MSKNIDSNKLKTLSDYLNDFKESYVVIGGTATSLLLEESVLVVEVQEI